MDEVLADQVGYYHRRASEYDVTAYGDVAAARDRIARLVAQMRPSRRVLEIACGTGLWTEALVAVADTVMAIDAAPEAVAIARDRVRPGNEKEAYVPGADEIVERRLRDGSKFQVVKNFVDPQALQDRLRDMGWDCEIRRDGRDWIRGEARPAPAGAPWSPAGQHSF